MTREEALSGVSSHLVSLSSPDSSERKVSEGHNNNSKELCSPYIHQNEGSSHQALRKVQPDNMTGKSGLFMKKSDDPQIDAIPHASPHSSEISYQLNDSLHTPVVVQKDPEGVRAGSCNPSILTVNTEVKKSVNNNLLCSKPRKPSQTPKTEQKTLYNLQDGQNESMLQISELSEKIVGMLAGLCIFSTADSAAREEDRQDMWPCFDPDIIHQTAVSNDGDAEMDVGRGMDQNCSMIKSTGYCSCFAQMRSTTVRQKVEEQVQQILRDGLKEQIQRMAYKCTECGKGFDRHCALKCVQRSASPPTMTMSAVVI